MNGLYSRLLHRLGSALPARCLACGLVPGDPVCPACTRDYFGPALRCRRCALRIAAGEFCGGCLSAPPRFAAAWAAADYAPPVSGMVLALKSGARLDLALPLGRLLARALGDGARADCVLPIPLSPERRAERGYNQSELLAAALVQELSLPLAADLLVRVRHDAPQQSLALDARRRNVRGAYAAARPLSGETVLLIDDVMTTGATLDEAADALVAAGAGEVRVAVVARTP
jgi:ComF family protein